MSTGPTINITVGVTGAQQAAQQLSYIERAARSFGSELSGKLMGMFSAVAIGKMAFDKVNEAMEKNYKVAKQIGNLSAKFHIEPKEVHSLLLASENAGVSVRSLLMGLKSLGQAASKASFNKDFANTFKTMGMDAKNLGDMATKPAKHFAEVALQLSKIGSETLRAEIGARLLGRQYQALAPLIEKLGASKEARDEFLKNENAMSNRQIQETRERAAARNKLEESFASFVAGITPFADKVTTLLNLVVLGLRMIATYLEHRFGSEDGESMALKTAKDVAYNARVGDLTDISDEDFEASGGTFVDNEGDYISKIISEGGTRGGGGISSIRFRGRDKAITDYRQGEVFANTTLDALAGVANFNGPDQAAYQLGSESSRRALERLIYGRTGKQTEKFDPKIGKNRKLTVNEKQHLFMEGWKKLARKADGTLDIDLITKGLADEEARNAFRGFAEVYNANLGKNVDGRTVFNKGGVEKTVDKLEKHSARSQDYEDKMKYLSDEAVKNWASLLGIEKPKQIDTSKPLMPDDEVGEGQHKKKMTALERKARLAAREKALALAGKEDPVERALISEEAAKIEEQIAVDALGPKVEEFKAAKTALDKALEELKTEDALFDKGKSTREKLAEKQENKVVKEKQFRAIEAEVKNLEAQLDSLKAKTYTAGDAVVEARRREGEQELKLAEDKYKDDLDYEKELHDLKYKNMELEGANAKELAEEKFNDQMKWLERARMRQVDYDAEVLRARENENRTEDTAFEIQHKKELREQTDAARKGAISAMYGLNIKNSGGAVSELGRIGGGRAFGYGVDNPIDELKKSNRYLEIIAKNTGEVPAIPSGGGGGGAKFADDKTPGNSTAGQSRAIHMDEGTADAIYNRQEAAWGRYQVQLANLRASRR